MRKLAFIVLLTLCFIITMIVSAEGTWNCPACGQKGIITNYCGQCGAKAPDLWDCLSCGNKNNTSEFCPNCGAKRTTVDSIDLAKEAGVIAEEQTITPFFLEGTQSYTVEQWLKEDDSRSSFSILAYSDAYRYYATRQKTVADYIHKIYQESVQNNTIEVASDGNSVITVFYGDTQYIRIEYNKLASSQLTIVAGVRTKSILKDPYQMNAYSFGKMIPLWHLIINSSKAPFKIPLN